VQMDFGYLGNGKTVERFRRQGAQSALIGARLELANTLGCSDAVSETYRFLESSYRNLQRAGFVELYARSIYRWESGSQLR
jgi:GNAT superfamily N-acetyltransferase